MLFPGEPCENSIGIVGLHRRQNGRASKWDLIKVVGTESQFHYWVEEFLLKDRFIEEQRESNHYFYGKTETGSSCKDY